MDFYEAVRRRRMVRNFTDEPVDPAAVERIVAAGTRAPSAGFSQGQSLIVITDPDTRTEVARLAGEEHYVAKGFDPWISRAPVHIVVCVSEETYRERYRLGDKSSDGIEKEWDVPYWWVDSGATMMLLLLAAVAEGLAAGFLGVHAIPELKSALGIPDSVAPIGVVTIGHGAPDQASGSLAMGWKAPDQVVHRDRW